RKVSYRLSKSGSDWNEIYVRDIETAKDIDEHIEWVKFSGISWYDNGFYYSGYWHHVAFDARLIVFI
ncbi:MAG: hypothetical protein DSZ15_01355, partial [Candidatus Thioglobus sp.]